MPLGDFVAQRGFGDLAIFQRVAHQSEEEGSWRVRINVATASTFIAPDRVINFAAAGDGIPVWLALLKGVWLALATGYTSTSGFEPMDMLASRGGMESMLNTIWLIVTALGFGGVVEKAGVLDRLITPIIERAKSDGALVSSLVASVFATNVITADQYIAIVLPGRMFKSAFAKRGFDPVVLSRTVGDTPTGIWADELLEHSA